MGARLTQIYNEVKEKHPENAMMAQLKLAMMTKMSSVEAASAPDSDELVSLFEEAAKTI